MRSLAADASSACGVYAPPRGGLVMGVMLSHLAGIPLLAAPCDGCIVVDDIADSGETLLHVRKSYECIIATMYYVEGSAVTPDIWRHEKRRGDWVVFPWEAVGE